MHLRLLIQIFRKQIIYAKRSKGNIGTAKVSFLGVRISSKGVSINNHLSNAIFGLPIFGNANDVPSFVGLSNLHRRFFKGYVNIMQLITDIFWSKTFLWTEKHVEAFKEIKLALITAPVLATSLL